MRHLLSYLLFVGIPLGGLLTVLRLGQALEAGDATGAGFLQKPFVGGHLAVAGAQVLHPMRRQTDAVG